MSFCIWFYICLIPQPESCSISKMKYKNKQYPITMKSQSILRKIGMQDKKCSCALLLAALELISIRLALIGSMWMRMLNRFCLVMVGVEPVISAAGFVLQPKEDGILLSSLPAPICDKHWRLPH